MGYALIDDYTNSLRKIGNLEQHLIKNYDIVVSQRQRTNNNFILKSKSFLQLAALETSAISVNKRSSCSGCCMQVAMHLPRKLLVFSNYLLFIFCMLFSLFVPSLPLGFVFNWVWVVCKIMFNFQIIFMCMIFMTMCRN